MRKLYTETLVRRGDITLEEAESALDDFNAKLQAVLDEVRQEPSLAPTELPAPEAGPVAFPTVETGVAPEVLRALSVVVRTVPEGFTVHPKLERQFAQRDELVAGGQVDWALAEALAIGSLMYEGVNVRLTGQDTRRGTFSHRHAVLVDYANGEEYVPLAHIRDGLRRIGAAELEPAGEMGNFTVRDSLLSEYAAVGFEYGYSVEAPEALVAWEAQFGDFANGAQIIIDNFLVAAENKWGAVLAGSCSCCPTATRGRAPSTRPPGSSGSSRCARGATCASTVPSTSAQYFHLLRSQALLAPKRPLVVVTPKSLLRAHASRSTFSELTSGSFRPVIDDAAVEDPARSVASCCAAARVGHEAEQRRAELGPEEAAGVAIVWVEQIYPWPVEQLTGVFERYTEATEVVWLQEEPENMGAWSFVHARLHACLPDRLRLRHVSRPESASPAIGSAALHQLEQADLLRRSIG